MSMSDELIVCIVILILSAIITAISIIYICALLAVTRAEEYQKDERDIIRDPADIIRRIPEGIHPGRQSEGCSEGCIRKDTGRYRNIEH
jgi:hypothetical protein